MEGYFLELLRAGLWDRVPDPVLFENSSFVDWDRIYQLSREQTVSALVFDGMEKLPLTLRPSRNLLMKWFAEVSKIEEFNRRQDLTVAELNRAARSCGVTPILLKGQGIARSYVNPAHRSCGDIDWYVGVEGMSEFLRTVADLENVSVEMQGLNSVFVWKGISIEFIPRIAPLSNPIGYLRFKSMFENDVRNGVDTLSFGDERVRVLSVELNLIYIFLHISKHFMVDGIGLRQICDWARLLYVSHGLYDSIELQKQFEKLGVKGMADVFGALLIDYLGFPEEKFPWKLRAKDHHQAGHLINDIFSCGNFGKVRNVRARSPRFAPFRKLFSFGIIAERSVRMFRLSPLEAIFLPLKTTVNSVLKQIAPTRIL